MDPSIKVYLDVNSYNTALRLSTAPAIPLCTCIFWVADGEGAAGDLLLEEILLVEEEDDGGLSEPLVVADGVEKLHALMHPVLKERRNCSRLIGTSTHRSSHQGKVLLNI